MTSKRVFRFKTYFNYPGKSSNVSNLFYSRKKSTDATFARIPQLIQHQLFEMFIHIEQTFNLKTFK